MDTSQRVNLVFNDKYDGQHKARLAAGGHLTPVPFKSVDSGVVSLRGFCMVLAIAELNGLETWSTDIGNTYLEAKKAEKLFLMAAPKLGD